MLVQGLHIFSDLTLALVLAPQLLLDRFLFLNERLGVLDEPDAADEFGLTPLGVGLLLKLSPDAADALLQRLRRVVFAVDLLGKRVFLRQQVVLTVHGAVLLFVDGSFLALQLFDLLQLLANLFGLPGWGAVILLLRQHLVKGCLFGLKVLADFTNFRIDFLHLLLHGLLFRLLEDRLWHRGDLRLESHVHARPGLAPLAVLALHVYTYALLAGGAKTLLVSVSHLRGALGPVGSC